MKRQDYTLLAPSHLIEWNYHRERLDRDPWGGSIDGPQLK